VVVEDLEVKGMLESPGNSHSTTSAAWNIFADLPGYKCKREGTHFHSEGTPEETALAVDTAVVSAKRVLKREAPGSRSRRRRRIGRGSSLRRGGMRPDTAVYMSCRFAPECLSVCSESTTEEQPLPATYCNRHPRPANAHH